MIIEICLLLDRMIFVGYESGYLNVVMDEEMYFFVDGRESLVNCSN